MKKTKSSIIARKLLLSAIFKKLVSDYRERLGIPVRGFKEDLEAKKWLKNVSASKFEVANDFVKDVYEKFPEITTEFTSKIDIHLMFYLIDDDAKNFNSLNVSGCELAFLSGDNKKKMKEELEDGVYIKIGLYSTPSDVEKFIKNEWTFIKLLGEELKEKKSLPVKGKRIRVSPKESRDSLVWYLSRFSNEELFRQWPELISDFSNYKSINIKKIMKELGFIVTEENVRKIISLQRKLRK